MFEPDPLPVLPVVMVDAKPVPAPFTEMGIDLPLYALELPVQDPLTVRLTMQFCTTVAVTVAPLPPPPLSDTALAGDTA